MEDQKKYRSILSHAFTSIAQVRATAQNPVFAYQIPTFDFCVLLCRMQIAFSRNFSLLGRVSGNVPVAAVYLPVMP